MQAWTKILIHPLGLAGFALFLVFGLFAKLKRRDERRWLFPSAISMAFIALVGGLTISYFQIQGAPAAVSSQKSNHGPSTAQQHPNQVQQTSTGPGSPNVQGVQGPVTITIDQSSVELEGSQASKTPKRKDNPAKKKQP